MLWKLRTSCRRFPLRSGTVAHADETPFQVLQEEGQKAVRKSWMWIFCSTYGEEARYVVMRYLPSRSAAVAHEPLDGFSGMLTCDEYKAYETNRWSRRELGSSDPDAGHMCAENGMRPLLDEFYGWRLEQYDGKNLLGKAVQ